MKENKITRKEFLDYIIGACFVFTGLSALGTVSRYLWPPKGSSASSEKVQVLEVKDIPVNGAKLVIYNNKPAIIINGPSGFVALSAVCTHLGCIVKWDDNKKVLLCPCHAGTFNEDGRVLSGPPPAPLSKIPVSVKNGNIYLG